MTYCDRIRGLREGRGLNQAQVAAYLKINQKTYSDYELGYIRIPVKRLIMLAEFYDVNMDYIIGASDIKNNFPRGSCFGKGKEP